MICDNSATIFKGHNSLAGRARIVDSHGGGRGTSRVDGRGEGCTVVSPQAVISWLRSSLAGAKCFKSFATSAFVRERESETKSDRERERVKGREREREGERGNGAASESESWPPI